MSKKPFGLFRKLGQHDDLAYGRSRGSRCVSICRAGSHSELTRCWFSGKKPRRCYNSVLELRAALLMALKALGAVTAVQPRIEDEFLTLSKLEFAKVRMLDVEDQVELDRHDRTRHAQQQARALLRPGAANVFAAGRGRINLPIFG